MEESQYDPSAYQDGAQRPTGSGLYAPPEPPESFFPLLPRALVFPVVGKGRMMLLAGGLTFYIANVIATYSILGIFLSLMVAGYLCAYMFKVIQAAAGGDNEPPDWPEFTDIVDDVILPLVVSRCGPTGR